MATYKVLQDIEAEDKLLGPLTLRQLIYAGIAAGAGYLSTVLVLKGVAFMALPFIPIILVCGFFAFPWGRDQPTEVWALAKIRFLIKPRKRLWDQTGTKDLVHITAPKHVERNYTNGLSQNEVHSRLNALASTIDSRGWAIKNVDVNLYSQPSLLASEGASDRLIDLSSLPQEVPAIDVRASDDMLDEHNNPVAQQFDQMIAASAQNHREQLIKQMNQPGPIDTARPGMPALPADYWFLNQPTQGTATKQPTTYVKPEIVTPGATSEPASVTPAMPSAADEELLKEIKQHKKTSYQYSHLLTIQPPGTIPEPSAVPTTSVTTDQLASVTSVTDAGSATVSSTTSQPSPTMPDPAIMELAGNNDLSVATIAREANKAREIESQNGDEVVISLH